MMLAIQKLLYTIQLKEICFFYQIDLVYPLIILVNTWYTETPKIDPKHIANMNSDPKFVKI